MKYTIPALVELPASVTMPNYTWEQLATVTARLETLRGERKLARDVGNFRLRDQLDTQIEHLLERRDRLIAELAKDSSKQ